MTKLEKGEPVDSKAGQALELRRYTTLKCSRASAGLFVCGILVFFAAAGSGLAETGRYIARGWLPGEYFCTGPDSGYPEDISTQRLYYTSDFGQHIEPIQPYGTGIHWGHVRTDAQEGCLYCSYAIIEGDNYTTFIVRSFDYGEHWEELEMYPWTTGRVPGECYAAGRSDSIRYSTDYGSSYQSLPSNKGGNNLGLLVGHQDGEVYYPSYDLWRSADTGRTFEVVYAGADSGWGEGGPPAFYNHKWLARGVLDGELYLLDQSDFKVYRGTDHGRTWRMQCDLNRNDYAHGRPYWWDIKAGVDSGEVVIYGKVYNYYIGGTIKFLVSHDYGQNFEEFTPFDYPPSAVQESPPMLPQLCAISAFPNPFNRQCSVEFSLASPQSIELNVIDVSGRLVDRLAQGYYNAGSHRLIWSSPSINTGCYFLVLESPNNISKYKLVIIK